jgi:Cu(I)/Ag(I) efflux system membrane fusion protein
MVFAMLLLAGTSTFAQAKKSSTHKHHSTTAQKYTCTMHPEMVRSKPGKCPKVRYGFSTHEKENG